jgi:hypothetical protein
LLFGDERELVTDHSDPRERSNACRARTGVAATMLREMVRKPTVRVDMFASDRGSRVAPSPLRAESQDGSIPSRFETMILLDGAADLTVAAPGVATKHQMLAAGLSV